MVTLAEAVPVFWTVKEEMSLLILEEAGEADLAGASGDASVHVDFEAIAAGAAGPAGADNRSEGLVRGDDASAIEALEAGWSRADADRAVAGNGGRGACKRGASSVIIGDVGSRSSRGLVGEFRVGGTLARVRIALSGRGRATSASSATKLMMSMI